MSSPKQSLLRHFSSLRHAQILWWLLIWSVIVASTTSAQLTIDTTLSNSIIAIQRIFLSANGLQTGANSTIALDGLNGDVRRDGTGTLSHPDYSTCTDPDGCVLVVNAAGMVVLSGATPGTPGTSTSGSSYWTNQPNTPLDTGAYDINFWDPALISGTIPGSAAAKQDHLKVRIGINSGGTSPAGWPQLIVAKTIETREWLIVNYPLNGTNPHILSAGSNGGTRSELTTNATDGDKALTIKSHYRGPSQTTSSFIHLKSSDTNIQTNVGINTPSTQYPTRALDNNGETLLRDNLNVGYNSPSNPVTTIRQPVGALIPSTQNPSNYNTKSCTNLPAPVACGAGTCNATSYVGTDVGTHYCYTTVGGQYQMYVVFTTNNFNVMTVDTGTQRVGINTLSPQSTLDVVGNSTFGWETSIVGTIVGSTGMTSVKLAEVDSTESTPYTLAGMCCKVLSVDANSNITLVDLPAGVCTPAPSCPVAQETYQYSSTPRNTGSAALTIRCGCDTDIHTLDSACNNTGSTYIGNVASNVNLTCYDFATDSNIKKQHVIQMINYVAGWNSTLQYQLGTNAITSVYNWDPKCTCDSSDGADCSNPTFTSTDVWPNCIDRNTNYPPSYIPRWVTQANAYIYNRL